MKCNFVVAGVLLLLVTNGASAQQKPDTSLKNTTIEVIQSYKPEVRQAPKPELTPDMPARDQTKPQFRYEVPQQTLYYTFSSLPLRPLALGKDTTKLPFPGYLKIGGGNLSTIIAEAGIGNFSGPNYETALQLKHLSQAGNIRNQKSSLTSLQAEGTVRDKTYAWRLSLDGSRNRYHYYGYNHDLFEYSGDTVRQTFTGIQAALDVSNLGRNSVGIDYHPDVRAGYYADGKDVFERTIALNLPISRTIDSNMTVSMGFSGVYTRLTRPSSAINNSIVQLTPLLIFRSGNFSGRLGIYPTFGRQGNSYLLPDITARYGIPNSAFVVSAGWQGRLRQNTYQELSVLNPYMFNMYETRQTRLDEVYGSVSVAVRPHLTLSGRLSWWQFNNLPMFMNDSADGKNFYLLYDDLVNAVSFQANIRYQVASTFTVGVTGMFYNYNKKTYERVWHEPGVRIKADMSLMLKPNFTITGYATIFDQIYARNLAKLTTKLDGVFDLGIGAEYSFIPRLSAFANVNNLLNNRYQRWYGYESYGFNIYGGLRLKF